MKAHDPHAVLARSGELEFQERRRFNEGSVGVYWADRNMSPWERHPDDDEFLQVLAGEVEITVLTDTGRLRCAVW